MFWFIDSFPPCFTDTLNLSNSRGILKLKGFKYFVAVFSFCPGSVSEYYLRNIAPFSVVVFYTISELDSKASNANLLFQN